MGWGSGDGPAGRKPPLIVLRKVYCTIKIQKVIYPSAAGSRINNGRVPDGHKRRGPGLLGGGVPPCPVCPPRLRAARRLRDDPNKVGSGTPATWYRSIEVGNGIVNGTACCCRKRIPYRRRYSESPIRGGSRMPPRSAMRPSGELFGGGLDKWGMAFYYLIS